MICVTISEGWCFSLKEFIIKGVILMKNAIRKIAAAAMAFTLLGAGTAATKSIAPQKSNTTVASAQAYIPSKACKHTNGCKRVNAYSWTTKESDGKIYKHYYYYKCCKDCGAPTSGRLSDVVVVGRWR
jgi:hypothetical protein